MSDATNTVLQRAYELIENDELERAQELLAPLLETDDKNPSLWWVYSHALRDQSIGQLALDRVLELDPSYPGASELKDDVLEIQSRDPGLLEADALEGATAQDAAASAIDDWDDVQTEMEDSGETSGGRQGAVVLAVILFAFAAAIALVASDTIDISEILSRFLPAPEAEVVVVAAPTVGPATSISDPSEPAAAFTVAATTLPTDQPTAVATLEATAEATVAQATATATPESIAARTEEATSAPTEETTAAPSEETTAEADPSPAPEEELHPVSTFVRAVADSISDFSIERSASGARDTSLGRTIVIQVCAVPGPEFNSRLNQVLSAMVDLADAIPEDFEAVAAGLLNCDHDGASLRMIGVPVDAIRQFVDDDIDAKEFQRAWQPLS